MSTHPARRRGAAGSRGRPGRPRDRRLAQRGGGEQLPRDEHLTDPTDPRAGDGVDPDGDDVMAHADGASEARPDASPADGADARPGDGAEARVADAQLRAADAQVRAADAQRRAADAAEPTRAGGAAPPAGDPLADPAFAGAPHAGAWRSAVATAAGINVVAGIWLIIAPFVLGSAGATQGAAAPPEGTGTPRW
jgi:hypothetical protein